MDRIVARKLETDKDYRSRLVKLTKDYLKMGRDALAYWSNDFDIVYDTLMCYSPLTKKDFESLERGHPKRFTLPLTATQITTMTTYISQVLFGQETPHKVEGRGPEDEIPAEFVNQLLRWNAEQQPTYLLGYLWVQDCISLNRGIFYNSWSPIFRSEVAPVDVMDPEDVDPETGVPRTYQRTTRVNKLVGGYNRMELVSPYDFICDPALPLWRLNEMRFTGHRTVIPVIELQRRAKLPVDHPKHVSPAAVAELVDKAKKGTAQVDAGVPSLPGVTPNPAEIRLSRTAYERTRALQPTGGNQADKNDSGNVECWELWVNLIPSDNKIYGDKEGEGGDEPTMFQFLIAGGDVLLSLNESTYQHGMHPYSIGEGRPNAHFQFSPGWASILKGIQDYVDWLKNRHQEALSRTVGNIFVYDPAMVNVTDFMDPEKEGLLIALKPEAAGKKISEVFQQVPIKDLTENFIAEAQQFIQYSEAVTAANSSMQGANSGAAESATEYAGTMQMGAGRMTSIARILSTQALVPQTRQFVANFQQFMDKPQMVRFQSDGLDLPPGLREARALEITKDHIAGEYDFIAHDGTLPGTDGKKVAAITRLLEAAQAFPDIFAPGPGNINPRRLIFAGAKASGVNVDNFLYTAEELGPPPGAAGPMAPPIPGAPPIPPPGLPPIGAPMLPGPKPAEPALPDLTKDLVLPPVASTQPRPANI